MGTSFSALLHFICVVVGMLDPSLLGLLLGALALNGSTFVDR